MGIVVKCFWAKIRAGILRMCGIDNNEQPQQQQQQQQVAMLPVQQGQAQGQVGNNPWQV